MSDVHAIPDDDTEVDEDEVGHIVAKSVSAPLPARKKVAFHLSARLRQLALFSIAAMGLWPLLLQLVLVPESVFGDGHGDRYEQLSYFALENDHYQVLEPRKVSCADLQAVLFSGTTHPTPTTDLVRAVVDATFKIARSLVVNQTTGDGFAKLSIDAGVLGLARDKSVCFGGVDDEGAVQIEALLSAQDAAAFGLDSTCIQGDATHMRLRLQPTEFVEADTMGELNPSRVAGAMLIVSVVDSSLKPVLSSCYDATREARHAATQSETEYHRFVSAYSTQLLVPETCGAYSALGTSGAVADLNADGAQRTYSFPAPWRMIQCTTSGECSSLLFTQLWLSEWSVQETATGLALRHNFVNHKVNEVTVDSTFSIRVFINLQILALVGTAYLTSVRGWHVIHCAFVSPWSKTTNATTACAIAKVARSSYNFILAAQMVLGMMQWRKQLTIDLLVGADTDQAVLRAVGCGTLVVVLAINIIFARAGDLKMQEMEPAFAHVVSFLTCIVLYLMTRTSSVAASARALLAEGMHSVSATEVTQYSGCRGSSVCAAQASLGSYTLVMVVVVLGSAFVGLTAHAMLQASARAEHKVGTSTDKTYQTEPPSSRRTSWVNSFTRFLDDRSRSTALYDCSTEVYVQAPGGLMLSTRGQLEACGFVLATTILFRYRDLPLFLAARALPIQVLSFFNLSVTIYELMDTGRMVNGLPIVFVADQIIHAHWSKLKSARLDWTQAYYGGADSEHRFHSGISS
jgi:hypothetical protein